MFKVVPVSSAIDIIKNRLEQDTELQNRAIMSAVWVLSKWHLFPVLSCHRVTCKSNCGQLLHGGFWAQSHYNCTEPPRIWKRYFDNTFVIQHQSQKDEFFRHINSVDPTIQLTIEESRADGSIPFLDTIITPWLDGTFITGVHRKPTHKDLYLPCNSYLNLASRHSVINTLTHRAKTICSTTIKERTETSGGCTDAM